MNDCQALYSENDSETQTGIEPATFWLHIWGVILQFLKLPNAPSQYDRTVQNEK